MIHRGRHKSYLSAGVILSAGFAITLICSPVPATAQQDSQAASTSSNSAAKPNINGTWTLNKDQSDDPRQKMQQAMGGSAGSGNGGGAWQGGGGRGRGGGGQGGAGGMMADFNQLTITQRDASVKIAGASGRVLTQTSDNVSPNSPSASQSGSDNGPQFSPAVAQWQGSQLVSVMEGRRGGKTTRTYQLSSDGKQLIVTTKIENERLNSPVTFRQVYDPASTGSQQSSQ